MGNRHPAPGPQPAHSSAPGASSRRGGHGKAPPTSAPGFRHSTPAAAAAAAANPLSSGGSLKLPTGPELLASIAEPPTSAPVSAAEPVVVDAAAAALLAGATETGLAGLGSALPSVAPGGALATAAALPAATLLPTAPLAAGGAPLTSAVAGLGAAGAGCSAAGVAVAPVVAPDQQPAAGVIFGCTSKTYDECHALSMVGLPRKYMPLVHSIVADHTLIFLFNFSDRMLHGVYRATSDGQDTMSADAWRGTAPTPKTSTGLGMELDDDDGSPFPAQCSFDIIEEFAPVPEAEFKHVLEYTERQRFKFKLSKYQCRDLIEAMCNYDAKRRTHRLLDELSLG